MVNFFNKKIIAKGIAKTDSNSSGSDSLLIHKDDLVKINSWATIITF